MLIERLSEAFVAFLRTGLGFVIALAWLYCSRNESTVSDPKWTSTLQAPLYSNAGEKTVQVKRWRRKWVAERARVKREKAWKVEV